MKTKYCAVFLAFHKNDLFSKEECFGMDDYPKEFYRVVEFESEFDALEFYANTMCPASQLVVTESKVSFENKIEQLKHNFQNKDWLKVNIEPFI